MRPAYSASRYQGRGGFVYVIRNGMGQVKIGISNNPNARLADLRTASPVPLALVWVGALHYSGFGLEHMAHNILTRYRMEGEWFECPVEASVAAIGAAASRLGEPIASVELARVDEIVNAVSVSTSGSVRGALTWCYLIIVAALVGVAIFAIVMGIV